MFIAKIALIAFCACVVNALPLGNDEEQQQVDLLAVESLPLSSDASDAIELTRAKRQFGYGGGTCRVFALSISVV